jgi:hypothetical protein
MATSIDGRFVLRGYRQRIDSRLPLFTVGMGRRDECFNLFL